MVDGKRRLKSFGMKTGEPGADALVNTLPRP
jgi:hypothetical protein